MNTDKAIKNTLKMLQEDMQVGNRVVAIFDIDGVVLDINHRLPHITHVVDGKQVYRPDADWDTFHSLQHQDTTGKFAALVRRLSSSGLFVPVFLSARVELNARIRGDLCARLNWGNGCPVLMEEWSLILRPEGSNETPKLFKGRVVDMMLERKIDIALAVDDSHENCLEFMKRGIPTLRAYNHLTPDSWEY